MKNIRASTHVLCVVSIMPFRKELNGIKGSNVRTFELGRLLLRWRFQFLLSPQHSHLHPSSPRFVFERFLQTTTKHNHPTPAAFTSSTMASYIDRRPPGRKRMITTVESPPPGKIVTKEQILQRGCPVAPRKPAPTSRKRSRRRGSDDYLVMHNMGRIDDEDEGDEPVRIMEPRRLFTGSPTHVQDVPRPTPRRALPQRDYLQLGQIASFQRQDASNASNLTKK